MIEPNLNYCAKCDEYIRDKSNCDKDDCDFFLVLVRNYKFLFYYIKSKH